MIMMYMNFFLCGCCGVTIISYCSYRYYKRYEKRKRREIIANLIVNALIKKES